MKKITFTEKKDTRSGFGEGLVEAAKRDANVVGLTADLAGSVKMDAFAKAYPERFVQVGIAEANMMGIAAGMAMGGKVPFASTFANFATSRVLDQIRQSIAYSEKNVKIAATHAGLTVGEDGATHQVLEDLGMIKMLPHMTVVVPCDQNQAYLATLAVAKHRGPVYLRLGRPEVPNFTSRDEASFEIGKGIVIHEGKDLTIVACGHLVWPAIEACEQLEAQGISVELINLHTIKPLDTKLLIASALKTRAVLTVEEHQINGGMGESIASLLSRTAPTPMSIMGVNDVFGESGKPQELLDKHGLNTAGIVAEALSLLNKKQ